MVVAGGPREYNKPLDPRRNRSFAKTLSNPEMDALRAENAELKAALARVTQQLEGFQRQLFGRKSERRLPVDPSQGNLLADLATAPPLLAAFPTAHHHRKYLHRLRGKYPRVSVGASPGSPAGSKCAGSDSAATTWGGPARVPARSSGATISGVSSRQLAGENAVAMRSPCLAATTLPSWDASGSTPRAERLDPGCPDEHSAKRAALDVSEVEVRLEGIDLASERVAPYPYVHEFETLLTRHASRISFADRGWLRHTCPRRPGRQRGVGESARRSRTPP
jgi:hypothetical protein